MKVGAILTRREADTIRQRLTTVSRLSEDRRVREQCRLVHAEINKAVRRADKASAKAGTQTRTPKNAQ